MRYPILSFWVLLTLLLFSASCESRGKSPAHERVAETATDFSELPDDVQAQLEALGYVIATDLERGVVGVTVHDEVRAQPGWNLYASMHAREAILMDMEGRELHRWTGPSEPQGDGTQIQLGLWWRTVRLFPNGDLLAQADFGSLMKVDADSRLLWTYDEVCHHDFDVAPDGRIFLITGKGVITHERFVHPLTEDFVVELAANGVELRRVSLLKALVDAGQEEILLELRKFQLGASGIERPDVTHLNALQILGAPSPAAPEAFVEGRLLLSTPKNSRIMIMDFERGEVVWSLAGSFRYQHDPTLTDDGRVLLFDNKGGGDKRSRILALDPGSGTELWSYGGASDPQLFSECCGRVHPLKNGNLLGIVSMEGRAIEITPEREIVWEFRSAHEFGGKIAILNDVERIDPASLDPAFVARVLRSAN